MEQKKSSEKDYRKRSPHYFLIGLVVALSTTLLAFEYRTFEYNEIIACRFPVVTIDDIDELPPVVLSDPKVVPPPPPVPAPPAPDPEPDPVLDPVIKLDDSLMVDPPESLVDEPLLFENESFVKETIPRSYAEVMPEFIGGISSLYKFLGKNIKFPPLPLENGIEAKIHVQFVVNTDGSISDIEVLNPTGYGFDKEAIRVIKMMPNWKPGVQSGRKVRVYYIIPINFALKN